MYILGLWSLHGVGSNMLDCDIIVSEFKIQSCFYIHFFSLIPLYSFKERNQNKLNLLYDIGASVSDALTGLQKRNVKTSARWSYHYHLLKFTCTLLMTVQNVGSISIALCNFTSNDWKFHIPKNFSINPFFTRYILTNWSLPQPVSQVLFFYEYD